MGIWVILYYTSYFKHFYSLKNVDSGSVYMKCYSHDYTIHTVSHLVTWFCGIRGVGREALRREGLITFLLRKGGAIRGGLNRGFTMVFQKQLKSKLMKSNLVMLRLVHVPSQETRCYTKAISLEGRLIGLKATILDKINGTSGPPLPPISMMPKWRAFAPSRLHHCFGGDGG